MSNKVVVDPDVIALRSILAVAKGKGFVASNLLDGVYDDDSDFLACLSEYKRLHDKGLLREVGE